MKKIKAMFDFRDGQMIQSNLKGEGCCEILDSLVLADFARSNYVIRIISY